MVRFRNNYLTLLILVGGSLTSAAQDQYKYVVYFSDKEGSPFDLDQPDLFMSAEALERRARQDIPVDERDLPLSTVYLEDLEAGGYELLGQSRWLNAVLVASGSDGEEQALLARPNVRKVTWAALQLAGGRMELCEGVTVAGPHYSDRLFWQGERETEYGFSSRQIRMLNGQFLHNNGWKGSGITIAVLDAGFKNFGELDAFAPMRFENRVKGFIDLVDYDNDPFESSAHGTSVLSTMAAQMEGLYLGTAPQADYLLIKTEDIRSEQIVEEFTYVLGLEYADQMGADVINTSLGYTVYNHAEMNRDTSELNGDHLIASAGADIAAAKGMIVINSAGNEGDNPDWKYISIPSDADSVLAVGSVNSEGNRSGFSGIGWPGSVNVKPNVMALGEGSAVIDSTGQIVLSSGTSFSAPIVAGLTACLWQAFPERGNMEILRAIEKSSSRYLDPDNLSGYGIPDFQAAYALLYQEDNDIDLESGIHVFPNPFSNNITLTWPGPPDQDMRIFLINDIGQVLFEELVRSGSRRTVNLHFDGVSGLNMGLYFLKIKTSDDVVVFKLIKV